MPGPEFSDELGRIIKQLSERYVAPIFEPHVTLYSDESSADEAKQHIEKLANDFGPITLDLPCK